MVPCTAEARQVPVTIAAARVEHAQLVDTGQAGQLVGDLGVLDQPMLDEHPRKVSKNGRTCVQIRVGHGFHGLWALSFAEGTFTQTLRDRLR